MLDDEAVVSYAYTTHGNGPAIARGTVPGVFIKGPRLIVIANRIAAFLIGNPG